MRSGIDPLTPGMSTLKSSSILNLRASNPVRSVISIFKSKSRSRKTRTSRGSWKPSYFNVAGPHHKSMSSYNRTDGVQTTEAGWPTHDLYLRHTSRVPHPYAVSPRMGGVTCSPDHHLRASPHRTTTIEQFRPQPSSRSLTLCKPPQAGIPSELVCRVGKRYQTEAIITSSPSAASP